MELITVCVGVAVLCIIWKWFSVRNLPPGPIGIPLLGNMLSLDPVLPHLTLCKWAKTYGNIITVKVASSRWIVISDPKILREAFAHPDMNGRPSDEAFSVTSGGQHGIICTEGEMWKTQRRFAIRQLRDFGFGKKSMEAFIMEEVHELIENFKSQVGKAMSIQNKFSLAMLNVLWNIVAGERFSQDDPRLHAILEGLHKIFVDTFYNIPLNLAPGQLIRLAPRLLGLQRAKDASELLLSILRNVVSEHQKILGDENTSKDFTDAYLHEIRNTDDPKSSFYKDAGLKNLVGLLADLFQAGAETTATTLDWAVLYLSVNQRVQKKLNEELDRVIGKNRQVTLDDRINMPYTEAILLETLRISSIFSLGAPHTATRETQLQGYTIPKGSWIITNMHYIQNNPEVWTDPENFRPERFLDEEGKTILKHEALVAFSTGPRHCLGENLARSQFFLFLSNLFQRFSFVIDPNSDKPSFVPVMGLGCVLHTKDYKLIIQDRLS